MSEEIKCICSYKVPSVLAGFSQGVRLAVRIQGPETPKDLPERSALRLAIVLDRSGSMSGMPLEEAKRCAIEIVSSLSLKDKVSIITYDNTIRVVAPLTSLEERSSLIGKIKEISSGGMTNLFGGWEMGAKQLEQQVSKDTISRILILSDGQANEGLTEPSEIYRFVQNFTDKGISTSTYGLSNSFNEDLMVGMANAGNGSSYYGETADDLREPFMEELALLNAICAKNLQVSFDLKEGISCSIINQNIVEKDSTYNMMNLTYDGEAWLAFELTIPASLSGKAKGEMVSFGTVNCSYDDLEGKKHQVAINLELPSLSLFAFEVLSEDEWLETRLAELEVSEIQMQAKKAAKASDWKRVNSLLAQAKEKAGTNKLLQEIIEELEQLAKQQNASVFTKEVVYSHRSMNYSLSSQLADTEMLAPERQFLSKKSRQRKARSKPKE